MSIAFEQIPGDVRVPLFMAETNGGTPPYSSISRMLLIGRADEEVLPPLTLVNVGSADPTALCGRGSMLAEQVLHAREVNKLGEIYVVGVPDGEDGEKATGSVAFTGPALTTGMFGVYVAGERYGVRAKAGDSAATIATKFRNSVNAGYIKFGRVMGAPVTAQVDGTDATKVNLTARFVGPEGNEIRILRNIGSGADRVRGVDVTITPMSGGLADGSAETALALVAGEAFDWISGPFDSATFLDAVRDFMRTRWDPLTQLDGHYVTARQGSLSALTAFGVTRNDPHVTIAGVNNVPTPSWVIAATLCGEIAFRKNLGRPLSQAAEIARPMQGLLLPGVLPPVNAVSNFTPVDRDSLLRNGISTITFDADGQARCDRIITTYRTNAADLLDTTFLDIESVAIAAYTKRYFRNALLGEFPRHIMRETNPNGVQGVATPPQLKGCVIHAYEEMSAAGVVRQEDEFAAQLLVECDYENDRANFYLPVSKAAALRIFAVNLTLFSNLTPSTAQL